MSPPSVPPACSACRRDAGAVRGCPIKLLLYPDERCLRERGLEATAKATTKPGPSTHTPTQTPTKIPNSTQTQTQAPAPTSASSSASASASVLASTIAALPISAIASPGRVLRISLSGEDGIEELAESIRSHGILQPILVRRSPSGSGYTAIAGLRRLKAALKAGLKEVPAVVLEAKEEEAFELSLIENIQRKDLSDYEVAKALEALMPRYGTQEALAKRLGKSRTWVANHLRMLELEAPGSNVTRVTLERLTEGQARALLEAPPERRREILERFQAEGRLPSMREIEAEVKPIPIQAPIPSPIPAPAQVPATVPSSASAPAPAPALTKAPVQEAIQVSEPKPAQVQALGKEKEKERREIDTNAVFECNVCHGKFLIVHYEPSGKHGFKPLKGSVEVEVEDEDWGNG